MKPAERTSEDYLRDILDHEWRVRTVKEDLPRVREAVRLLLPH
jgi:hypothetical protein